MANEKNTQEQISDFYDFSGLEHFVSSFLAKENTLDQLVNFVSTGIVGGKTTRPPYGTFLNTLSSPIRNLIYWVYYNSSGVGQGYLVAIAGRNLYTYLFSSGASTWTIQTGLTCSNANVPYGYTVLNNSLHLSNGIDVYQTWNPANGFTTYPEAPQPQNLISYQNRVYGVNTPGNVSRVYFSSVDYVGAPGETSYLTANSSASATTLTINDPIFLGGTNPVLSANVSSSTGMHWQATIGLGTANQENVIVTGIAATVSGNNIIAPYTITLASGTANSHTQYDVVANIDPWYSDNNNASSANYFDPNNIGASIGQDIVNNNLVLHKSSGGIYLYNGNTISNPLQANNPSFNSPAPGSTSPFSIDQISGNEFYLNRDAVWAYTGGYPTNISYSVYDFIQNMQGSQYAIAPGVAFNQKYYLSIGNVTDKLGNTIKNCILVYDYVLNFWETYSFGVTPISFCVGVDQNGNQQLYFGDANGQVYQYNTGSANNGQPANAILQTHYLTWGAPEKTKECLSYNINTSPGANYQFQAATDWSNNWKTITTASGFGISDNAPLWMRNFKSISFRIISNTIVPMTLYGFGIKLQITSRRNSGRRI